MKLIGIAGGSGSGKSTVSYELVDRHPDIFEVIHLDDYQKLSSDPNLPMVDEVINWDHPDIVRWDRLIDDITSLKNGTSITVQTWADRSNPDYFLHRTLKELTIEPKPVVIVEGYLALYHEKLRTQFTATYFLHLDDKTRSERRDKNAIVTDEDYEKNILHPMFIEYVEPTKIFADNVIEVSDLTVNQIAQQICEDVT